MKTKTLLTIGLCAGISLGGIPRSSAVEHEQHGQKAGVGVASVKVPETVEGVWAEIKKHQQELTTAVKAKKLGEVHVHAFAIRDLSKGLVAKAHPDHKKHVEGLVQRISQIAEDLDKTGDAGNQAPTEANLKKLNAALKTLEEHTK